MSKNRRVARLVYEQLREIGLPDKLLKPRRKLAGFTTHKVRDSLGEPQLAVRVFWWRINEFKIGVWVEKLYVKDGELWTLVCSREG